MNIIDNLKATVQVDISVTVALGTVSNYHITDRLDELHKIFSYKAIVALRAALYDVDNIEITGKPKFKITLSDL